MKLATTTGDFFAYTDSQEFALKHIRKAGFRYADYNFGCDLNLKNGVYTDDYEKYFSHIQKVTERLDIRLIQAHAPMGKPLTDGGILLKDTLRCVDACGAWNIKNLVVHSGYTRGLSPEETF